MDSAEKPGVTTRRKFFKGLGAMGVGLAATTTGLLAVEGGKSVITHLTIPGEQVHDRDSFLMLDPEKVVVRRKPMKIKVSSERTAYDEAGKPEVNPQKGLSKTTEDNIKVSAIITEGGQRGFQLDVPIEAFLGVPCDLITIKVNGDAATSSEHSYTVIDWVGMFNDNPIVYRTRMLPIITFPNLTVEQERCFNFLSGLKNNEPVSSFTIEFRTEQQGAITFDEQTGRAVASPEYSRPILEAEVHANLLGESDSPWEESKGSPTDNQPENSIPQQPNPLPGSRRA